MGLLSNKKHELFCSEYLVDLNGTAAYRRAGYSAVGNTAKVNACKLLGRSDIQDRIAELQQERKERVQVDGDRVVQVLADIMLSDITDVVNVDGGRVIVEDTRSLDGSVKSAIQSIAQTKNGIAVRMHSKPQAAQMLGNYLGLFSDINVAIATLSKYGINLKRTEAGWVVNDAAST